MKTVVKFLLIIICGNVSAINPFLPATAFIPDGEPHIFEYNGEKRVYVYGSRDERVTAYCGYGHDVWSAPVDNLTRWTNHGEIFHVKQVQGIGYGIVDEQHFGAPDCVYNPVTKKYYLYTFLGASFKMDGKQGPLPGSPNYIPGFDDFGPKCVMSESTSPAGPFINPVMCDWPPLNNAGTFDPSVLVDEQQDGSVRVYAFWGMKMGDRLAEIDPKDMHTIINPKNRKPDRNAWHKTLEPAQNNGGSTLFEASSIKKVADGKYVFIYSSNEHKSALTYCYSNSPEGPWNYGGRIIDTSINWRGGNNHGSIFQINGQWYVVYHRATSNAYNRQAMMEPIALTIEGEKVIIPTVEMTSQGVETSGLNAFKQYNAGIMCYRTNNAFVNGGERNADGLNPVMGIDEQNTLVGYKYLDFGKMKVKDSDHLKLNLTIRLLKNVTVTIKMAQPSQCDTPGNWISIATFNLQDYISDESKYHNISIPINNLDANAELSKMGGLKGKWAFFMEFSGSGKDLCRIKEFEFTKGNAPILIH